MALRLDRPFLSACICVHRRLIAFCQAFHEFHVSFQKVELRQPQKQLTADARRFTQINGIEA
jgi:hypothetical protein